ncbi:FGGY-family carbohydrate kinase [Niabella ginsengisoli]|uniref:Sugar kinase n=1 Tax=Niabella ginsengisoli TaxID=522298 RepID=A0ABS9SN29_9BACT|nr:FGGY family carbohydrate kinase [Niabella ginsengisoli]MCH5599791.1 sugar kinase [Niabella ginsengisoli]
MNITDAYIVIDIGTGNVRVAVVNPNGNVLGVGRGDINYIRDELYPESIYFEPDQLWQQIAELAKSALQEAGTVKVTALTTTSQREGIVLIGRDGMSLIGLPNIDHRGREWEDNISDKSRVYNLTGRYPTSLFSAYKLGGIRQRRPDMWKETRFFLSISDWAEYKLSGVAKYEHSQASETLLYDVAAGKWSDELTKMFNIDADYCTPVTESAKVSGAILPELAESWAINSSASVITGGGDTQLAIRSTQPAVDDVIIVSGTTTPIVKIVDHYITDPEERTWTSRDIHPEHFIFEANAGVTGLNYQRLKEVFYPNEGYDVIEKELAENPHRHCVASLGSLIATEDLPVISGGFVFPVPVSHELSRSSFVWATLLDIAFSISENYKVLKEVSGHSSDYVWACGGGLQSRALRQLIANIINKKVQVRTGFEQASAVGGAMVCNEALGIDINEADTYIDVVAPEDNLQSEYEKLFDKWKNTRAYFKKLSAGEK